MAFALTTLALAQWQTVDFQWHDVWPLADDFRLHPLHLLLLGIAMIPPTVWEIFLLDSNRGKREPR